MFCAPFPAPQPTIAGLQNFVINTAGVPQAAIPEDSEWWGWAFGNSLTTVNPQIQYVGGPQYMLACYYLGTDFLINWAPDQPGVVYPTDNPPPQLGYFAFLRKKWDLTGFVAGVIEASVDESTSESLTVPDAMKGLTFGDLLNLRTPWGRNYLAIAQKVGTLWGIT